jgi:anti-sigma factor RsiW
MEPDMNCPIQHGETSEILLDYCAGKLGAEQSAALEAHLQSCTDCAAVVEAQRSVWNALGEWEATPVSADFDRKLYARIEGDSERNWFVRLVDRLFVEPLGWRPAVPVAAAAIGVIAIVLLQNPATKPTVVPPSQPRVESVDIEQIERTLEDLEMLKQIGPVTDTAGAAG